MGEVRTRHFAGIANNVAKSASLISNAGQVGDVLYRKGAQRPMSSPQRQQNFGHRHISDQFRPELCNSKSRRYPLEGHIVTTKRKISEEAGKIFDILDHAKLGMLVTGSQEAGALDARPMSFVEIDRESLVVRMFSSAESMKEDEIKQDPRGNISCMDLGKQSFVSLSGLVTISNDMELKQRLWKPIHLAWFPDGVEDVGLRVVEFRIVAGRFWDSPSSKVVQVFGIAKAILTHETYKAGSTGLMGELH